MSGENDDEVEVVIPYTFRFKFSKLGLKKLEEAAKDRGLSMEDFLKRSFSLLEKYFGAYIEEAFIALESGVISAGDIEKGAIKFGFDKVREEDERRG